MTNHVFITDQEGTLLWEGASSAPFLGLQAGETFWFGSLQDRVWVSIISISYGLDTASGDLHVELIVQTSGPKPTKTALSNWKMIDHGEKKVKGARGGMISIDNGRIVVTVGKSNHDATVDQLTLQINTPHGPIIETQSMVQVGSAVRVEDTERIVIATLTWADTDPGGGAGVRTTEHVAEDS